MQMLQGAGQKEQNNPEAAALMAAQMAQMQTMFTAMMAGGAGGGGQAAPAMPNMAAMMSTMMNAAGGSGGTPATPATPATASVSCSEPEISSEGAVSDKVETSDSSASDASRNALESSVDVIITQASFQRDESEEDAAEGEASGTVEAPADGAQSPSADE